MFVHWYVNVIAGLQPREVPPHGQHIWQHLPLPRHSGLHLDTLPQCVHQGGDILPAIKLRYLRSEELQHKEGLRGVLLQRSVQVNSLTEKENYSGVVAVHLSVLCVCPDRIETSWFLLTVIYTQHTSNSPNDVPLC